MKSIEFINFATSSDEFSATSGQASDTDPGSSNLVSCSKEAGQGADVAAIGRY